MRRTRKLRVKRSRKIKKRKQPLKGGNTPVKIAFYSNHLGERGTEVAMYDYAFYNKTLLHNTSIIIYNNNNSLNNPKVIDKFKKEFDLFEVSSIMNKDEIDKILSEQKCDIIYMIVDGGARFDVPTKAKVCVHCVFNCIDPPFGDVYAAISSDVDGYTEKYPIVPHMINLPSHDRNMRNKLSIPDDAIVFGRYGGKDSFDIDYVKKIVCDVAKTNKNIYFLFGNTDVFCESMPNIIHLDVISGLDEKVEFINTCDAMLWARKRGESFGLSIGEFSSKNKPVFATDKTEDKAHVDFLKDMGIWYDENTLKDLLVGFNKETYKNKDLNAYKEFTPEKVMEKFKSVFIDPKPA